MTNSLSFLIQTSIKGIIVGCCLAGPAIAADLSAVKSSLLVDIRVSQEKLDEESTEITKQSDALATKLGQQSRGLADLRRRAAAVRRQSDEQLVGLATLEERVKVWRSQDSYRRNLLWDFSNRQGDLAASQNGGDLESLKAGLARLRAELTPAFVVVDAATESGEIVRAESLKLGPVRWFWTPDATGLLHVEDGKTLRIGHRFERLSSEAVERVRNLETAFLRFDPTIDQLLKARITPPNFLEQLTLGGIWVLPILGFGLLATLIAVSKSVQFLRLPRIVSLGAMVDAVNLASKMPKGPQRDIIEIVLANDDAEERDDLLFALLIEEKSRLERFLGAIAVTATVSPLLGLLGTVSGMINTFNMMTLFGAGDPSIVSGGISEALITTELGLVVAIPALIMHALLTRKANSYIESLESSAILMTQAPGRAR